MTGILSLVALAAGLALGIVVTRGLHGNPRKVFWNTRLGSSSWRRANLPVGGTLAAIVATLLFALGRAEAATITSALGVGMALGAIGIGMRDPLPPVGR